MWLLRFESLLNWHLLWKKHVWGLLCVNLGSQNKQANLGKMLPETIKESWNLSEGFFQKSISVRRGREPHLWSNPTMASDGQGYLYLSILRLSFLNKNMLILFWQADVRIRDNLLTTCRIRLMWYFLLPTSSLHCLLLPVLPPPPSFHCHCYCLLQTFPLPEPEKFLLHRVRLLQLPMQGSEASQVEEHCVFLLRVWCSVCVCVGGGLGRCVTV